jgi:hypothetical protein
LRALEARIGAPEGPRPVTVLRNRIAGLAKLLGRRQKEISDDLMPEKDATERINSTFDYCSHHRQEIEIETARLKGLSLNQAQLEAMLSQDSVKLRELASQSKKQRREPAEK